MSGEKLLFKGHVLKLGDFVKATDTHSGAVIFYRVDGFGVITEPSVSLRAGRWAESNQYNRAAGSPRPMNLVV